jgi:hypothetical protein
MVAPVASVIFIFQLCVCVCVRARARVCLKSGSKYVERERTSMVCPEPSGMVMLMLMFDTFFMRQTSICKTRINMAINIAHRFEFVASYSSI